MGRAVAWVRWWILRIPHLWKRRCSRFREWLRGQVRRRKEVCGGEGGAGRGRAHLGGGRRAALSWRGPRRAPMGSGWQRAPSRSRALLLPGEGADGARRRARGRAAGAWPRRQGMRMAVGSVKMQPPCESPALAAVAAVAAADGALRRSPSAAGRERLPVAPRPRAAEGPAGAAAGGLTLRRKRSAAGGRVSGRVVRGRNGRGRSARGARAHPRGGRGRHLEVGEVPGVGRLCRTRQKRAPGKRGHGGAPLGARFPLP